MVSRKPLHSRQHVGDDEEVGVGHGARLGRLVADDEAAYPEAIELRDVAVAVVGAGLEGEEEGGLGEGEHAAVDEQALDGAVVEGAMRRTNDLSDLLNLIFHR